MENIEEKEEKIDIAEIVENVFTENPEMDRNKEIQIIMGRKFYTLLLVSKITRMSTQTLRKYIRTKKLTSYKYTNSFLVKPGEMERFMNEFNSYDPDKKEKSSEKVEKKKKAVKKIVKKAIKKKIKKTTKKYTKKKRK